MIESRYIEIKDASKCPYRHYNITSVDYSEINNPKIKYMCMKKPPNYCGGEQFPEFCPLPKEIKRSETNNSSREEKGGVEECRNDIHLSKILFCGDCA